MAKILKFGRVFEEDGAIHLRDFHLDGEGTNVPPTVCLLEMIIERLETELEVEKQGIRDIPDASVRHE